MQAQNTDRRLKPLWQKQCDRLRSVGKFTLIAQRILLFGLIATLIGVALGHFTRFPQLHLRWAAVVFITAWVGVEVLCKCLSAYFFGAARAGWMKRRSFLVDACAQFTTSVDHLQSLALGLADPRTKPVREAVREAAIVVPGQVQKILASVSGIDEGFRKVGDKIESGSFLVVGYSEALTRLPKIWERFSLILPGKLQREAFEPAFNDMLESYMRAQKWLGKRGQRWLAFAFTMCAAFIVLDCIRVMVTSGVGRFLLDALPEPIRAWWRRQ
jgi:hypothetical protein